MSMEEVKPHDTFSRSCLFSKPEIENKIIIAWNVAFLRMIQGSLAGYILLNDDKCFVLFVCLLSSYYTVDKRSEKNFIHLR